MAKRFTDTDKYKKPFIRGLQGAYKLLWDYLYHDCNHAGIWIIDFDIAQIYLGLDMPVNKKDALKYFNQDEVRIIEIDNSKWFIPSFITFQYGELNPNNRAHNSVITILNKYNLTNINNDLIRGLQDPMDKDKDKELDMDKDMDKDVLKKNENSIVIKEKIIYNNNFLQMALKSQQWIEITSMQNQVITDVIKLYLKNFESHLITMEEQKNDSKEFKSHFINWLGKQDLSAHRKKVIGKTNQIKR